MICYALFNLHVQQKCNAIDYCNLEDCIERSIYNFKKYIF